jgi:long-chain acyl-CoA synthetase
MIQGYGLTETSPVISVNRVEDNDPASVGIPLEDVEARIGEQDELLVRSPGIMLGYWANEKATREMIDAEGWLHTGDKARIQNSHLYITGRLKEIIVLANGEKVPPADMEMAISMDSLFEQAMVIGDNRPFLSALLVLDREQWASLAKGLNLNADDPQSLDNHQVKEAILDRVAKRVSAFPGYAQVRKVCCQLQPWTIEDDLITPTLKLKRDVVYQRFRDTIEQMYESH